jgi:uncharacterized protein (DUF697 family)
VSQTARFCNRCGGRLRQKEAPPPESLPTWSGWDPAPPAPVAAAPESSAAPPLPSVSEPSPPASAEPPPPAEIPSPPQYWESYDYPSEPSTRPAWQDFDSGPPRDASRPLPPLSQVLPPDMESTRERAREIILNFSLWAAGIVLFPVPFSDLVLLMPVQSAMVISIGRAYGLKDPPEKVLAILAGACGASVFGQITVLFVANFIPILGKFISAPFVFGWTYGLGEVAMRYFDSQGEASPDELRTIFEKASKEASRNYSSKPRIQPDQALDNIREYVSEEEYRKIRERFSSN